MRDKFANRLGMFRTVKQTLNLPEHVALWQNQPPLAFGTTFNSFTAALTDLESFIAEHGQNISGAAVDKNREKEELVTAAHELGSALAAWFRSQHDETSAGFVRRSITAWRLLRNEALLQQSQIVLDVAEAVVGGAQAAAAAAYGVTGNAVTALQDQRNDYVAVVASPQQKIAARKALTAQYRDRFNGVATFLDTLDGLILQHRKSASGRAFVAAYQASRIIRDLGSRPGSGDGTEPPSPPPEPPPPEA